MLRVINIIFVNIYINKIYIIDNIVVMINESI